MSGRGRGGRGRGGGENSNVPEEGIGSDPEVPLADGGLPQPTYEQMMQFMAAQWAQMQGLGVPIAAPAPALVQAAPAPKNTPIMQIFNQFKKHDPPKFSGEGELMEAERWLEEITEMMETLGVEGEEVKIKVAVRQFQGSAVHWWRSYRGTVNIHALTWEKFKEGFLEQFFPSVMREMKVQEFMMLQQEGLSVKEYERKFIELARFAP